MAKCPSPAVELEGVWKRFWRTWALQDVTMRIEGNGIHVLYGPNGSGKSTIIRIIMGITLPTRGRVRVLGFSPRWRPGRILRRVAAAIEGAVIPPYMSGREAALAVAGERGVPFDDIREAAERLGVAEYWDRMVFTYSMGMRKRLLLSIALGVAKHSCLLLLDEPYTLLDAKSKETVASMILEASRRKPVIVATHIITKAEEQASRVYRLDQGRLVETIEGGMPGAVSCRLTRSLMEWLAEARYERALVLRGEKRVLLWGLRGGGLPPECSGAEA